MEIGLRIAAPVLCIVLAETIAAAFIMKTMPQLNIMTIGFAMKVVIALFALIGSVRAIEVLTQQDIIATLDAIANWAATAGGGS